MPTSTSKPNKSELYEVYEKVYTALKKKDYDSFCKFINAPSGQKMPKEEFNAENIEMILGMMPEPKGMKFLNMISSGSNHGYQFLSNFAVEEGLYFYGMVFLVSIKNELKFSRVLVKNIEGKNAKQLEKTALLEMENDPDFALDDKEANKRSKVIKETKKAKTDELAKAGLSLKNSYQDADGKDFTTPTIKVQPPKNWFDMNSSGNSNRGGFEAYTMGGIGYSENGEIDYSTKRKINFQFAKSKNSIEDYAKALKDGGFAIEGKTKTEFVATRDDEFWGNQYQLIQKAKDGFLIFDIATKEKKDLEECKKTLKLLVGKVSLEF